MEELERDQLLAEVKTLRAAQLEAEHSRQLYVEMFEQAPIAYVNLTSAGRIESANYTAASLLHSEQPKLSGTLFRTFIHPDDQEKFSRHLKACEKERIENVSAELRLNLPRGNPCWVELISRQSNLFGTPQVLFRTVLRDISASKETTTALHESETRLRAIVDQSAAGVARMDLTGHLTFHNRQMAEILGYEAGELVGLSFRQLIETSDRVSFWRAFQRSAKTGAHFQCEARMRRKNGSAVWTIIHVSILLDEVGKPSSAAALVFNIAEKKRVETALRKNEEQFRRAIEEAPIPVIVHAEDGQVLEISKAWTKVTGYKRSEMRAFDTWLKAAGAAGADALREHMERTFRGEQRRAQLEVQVKSRADGLRTWLFSVSPVEMLNDGRRFLVSMAVDITERIHAATELARSREELRLIIENAREYAIISTDLNRIVTSWNAGAERLLGYRESEILGKTADLMFTAEDRKGDIPAMEASIALKKNHALDERWHLRKDGTRFWGSGVMMPKHDASGATVGLIKIFRDETESRNVREALEQNRQELRQALQLAQDARNAAESADKAKDHFLAVLSHELRTPLSPVLMATHVMLRRSDLPEDVREAFQMIQRNVKIEAHLVDDLLDVTRIARGKFRLMKSHVRMHAAIEQAVDICRHDIQGKKQRLVVSLKAKKHEIQGDQGRLQQVVWNLLKNASKFTPEGGKIAVRTRNERDRIVVEVSDSGIGLSPEALKKIFMPFVQADQEITQNYGGLGLGLTIAKNVTEAHGGNLVATSKGEGKGTTMTISLPMKNAGKMGAHTKSES